MITITTKTMTDRTIKTVAMTRNTTTDKEIIKRVITVSIVAMIVNDYYNNNDKENNSYSYNIRLHSIATIDNDSIMIDIKQYLQKF